MNSKTDEHRYLCDIPAPDASDTIVWVCTVCVVDHAQGGPQPRPVPVTVYQHAAPRRFIAVPLCAQHLAGRTPEQHAAAVVMMVLEEKFKASGGQPIAVNLEPELGL